ncbi:MAG: DNA polymerase III subunit gamma/tau [Deltaproteobacteria bacterium]
MPSYLVLARKYRPATFGDVVGQDHVVRTLTNSIVSGRVAHAFLFCGVRGVGKTTVARILAKALNCAQREEGIADPCNRCFSCTEIAAGVNVDVQEIDGASHTSVENIREINETIKYPPVASPYKIIIIDEVHMISINAFNALLKTLEEPPSHAKFIFATTESHKVPATINSRCQRFNFRTISIGEMTRGMARILEQEGVEASDEALALVAREALGSFRDALSLLDQVIAFGTGAVSTQDVIAILGIAGRDAFAQLVQAILSRKAGGSLRLLHELFRQGYDPEQLAMDLIHYLRNLIMVKNVSPSDRAEGMIDASPGELEELEKLAAPASPEELQYLFGMLVRGETEIKRSGNPSISLEMTVLRMAQAPDIVDLSEIIRRIDAREPPPRSVTESRDPDSRVPAPSPRAEKSSPRREESQGAEPAEIERRSSREEEKGIGERFVITKITPVPDGTPDEVWAMIRKVVADSQIDPLVSSYMEHGSLISFGPTEVEIGFNNAFYKDEVARRMEEKPALRKIFQDFFGNARIKTLTLAQKTPLDTAKPYAAAPDGESDRVRALKQEALDHPIVRAVQDEFDESAIEEIKILS